MQCMKCGRDVENGEVFCKACLEHMAEYPVKPGTVVQLPHRTAEPAPKKQPTRRKMLPPEEQLSLLKRLSRMLAAALVLAILLCGGLGYFAVNQYLENRDKQAMGQNYSAITTEPPVAETTEPAAETGQTAETEGVVAG